MLNYKHFLSQFLKIAFTNFLFFLNLKTSDSTLKAMMFSKVFSKIFEVIVKKNIRNQKVWFYNAADSSHIVVLKINFLIHKKLFQGVETPLLKNCNLFNFRIKPISLIRVQTRFLNLVMPAVQKL